MKEAPLAMVLVPVLFVLTAALAAALSRRIGTLIPVDVDATESIAEAFRASAFWRVSHVALIAAAIWNAVLSFACIHEYVGATAAWSALAIAFACGIVAAYVNRFFAVGNRSALSQLQTLGIPIRRITQVAFAIVVAVVVLLIGASLALMHTRSVCILSPEELRGRMEWGRIALVSTSVWLIIGVAEIFLRYDWPAHLPLGDANPAVIHHVALTIAVVFGGLFSIFLLELYAPMILVHQMWIADAADAQSCLHPDLSIPKWLEQEALNRTLWTTLIQIAAVAGPSLTAFGLPGVLKRR
ncbi:MAG TPA: hypothetical protein VJZ00_12220 [Thermoanaerobaculia bacterium]|nr:hypothetical protein [Thermoanaerobaculia bacterium]